MNTGRFTRFLPATPELLASRELLCRTDSKFVLPATHLDDLLDRLVGSYRVLKVPTGSVATYHSLYFDTPAMQCYHDHRRGRRLRHKIRIRHYLDRQLSYLEVKTKRNEAVTDKHRMPVPYLHEALGPDELEFLYTHCGDMVRALEPKVLISCKRLSLIGAYTNERVTIDLDIDADGDRFVAKRLGHLAVVEVKQSPFCVRTPVMRALIASGIRERSLSKYITVMALVRPELRSNRLLPDLRALERIELRE
jgi:hypothetical protein